MGKETNRKRITFHDVLEQYPNERDPFLQTIANTLIENKYVGGDNVFSLGDLLTAVKTYDFLNTTSSLDTSTGQVALDTNSHARSLLNNAANLFYTKSFKGLDDKIQLEVRNEISNLITVIAKRIKEKQTE